MPKRQDWNGEATRPRSRPSWQRSGHHPAWRMLVIVFLAQNCAIGMNFGIYGTIVTALEAEYATTRTLAASGLAAMTLVMGLSSPLVGRLTRRVSLRAMMIAGALICATGYALLALAPSIGAVLAIYALVIGPGVCLLGVLPSSTLVANWFHGGKGRALGFVNMPLFVSLFPILTAFVLAGYGLEGVFVMALGVSLALVPVLLAVVDTPARAGCEAYGANAEAGPQADAQAPGAGPLLEGRALHGNRSFQLIWFGIGAAIGALLFGWLADRIGGRRAVVVQALCWTVPWALLLVLGANLPLLLVAAGLAGMMSGAIVGLCGVLVGSWLGAQNFATAMGQVYFYKVPFLFGAAPLAGFLFEETGSYRLPVLLHIASFALVAALFGAFRPRPLSD
ncbi:MFS transporter [Croceicoccus mobilis]|nr:MFS transporter [Croceicoccus mobilis]